MIALAAVVPVRVVASVAAVVLVARVASVRVVAVFVVALRVPLAFGVMSPFLRAHPIRTQSSRGPAFLDNSFRVGRRALTTRRRGHVAIAESDGECAG